MKRFLVVGMLLAAGAAVGVAQNFDMFKAGGDASDRLEFTFMAVHVIDHGVTANEKFFLGPLPKKGEAVEMVYVGDQEDGAMKFQLRVKP